MALVGDILVRCRENGPDPASFLSTPIVPANISDGGAGNPGLPAGTYYAVVTFVSPWGESLPCAENSTGVAIASNHVLSVLMGAPIPQAGITAIRVYFGTSPGAEYVYQQFPYSGALAPTLLVGSGLATTVAGIPPVRPTAMIPDTDGGFVSAFTLYRWFNNALAKASRLGGGLPLSTAVQATANNGIYRIPGKWVHVSAGWFDGWPLVWGKKQDVFKHGLVTGIPGIAVMEQAVDTTVIQLWPQPNRTGATTTLSAPMGLSDVTASVALSTGFLSLGMLQVDSEIIAYFGTGGNTFSGLVRGYGGTLAATHLSGATVTELNLQLTGFGQPVDYAPGDSMKVLPIPPAWEEPLTDYLTAQFRKAELSTSEAAQIEKSFEASMLQIAKASRPIKGPAQIGGAGGIEVLRGGFGGGIILT